MTADGQDALREDLGARTSSREPPGEPTLLYVDLHLIHEVTSPQAFDGLRLAGRTVRRPDLSLATMDHNVPTTDGPIDGSARRSSSSTRCAANCEEFGVPLYGPAAAARASCTSSAPSSASRSPG